MWASRSRCQASVKGKISTLNWLEAVDGSSTDSEAGGWIAAGGSRSDLSVSWIRRGDDCFSEEDNKCGTESGSTIYKTHFNLRGHSVGIKYVRWKPQGDKLLSFDSWGNLIVWKNRSHIFASDFTFTVVAPITDIQWSPCGMYIALCGDEGQLQVVSGHDGTTIFAIHAVSTALYGRYAEFSCLSWNVDSTRIVLGTSRGEVIEVDPNQNGHFLSMMTMHENTPVCKVDYFGRAQYFKIPNGQAGNELPANVPVGGMGDDWMASQGLSVYMEDGEVAIFNTFTETRCSCVQTRISGGVVSWNNSQTLLAVVGHRIREPSCLMLRLVNTDAHIVMTIEPLITLPYEDVGSINQCRVSSVCWGLKDTIIFFACGSKLLSVDIVKDKVPSLRRLCREYLTSNCTPNTLQRLPLPNKEITVLKRMTSSLIPLLFETPPTTPPTSAMYEHLFTPLPDQRRTHCIIVTSTTSRPHNGQDNTVYTLLYEHFGSYIPLLKARRKSKILQHIEFEIRPVESLPLSKDCSKQQDCTYLGATPPLRSDGGATPSFGVDWGATPSSPRNRRRSNSLTDNTRLTRIRKAFQQKLRRPNSAVVEGILTNDDMVRSPIADRKDEGRGPLPTIAEVSGTRFMNRFRITSIGMTEDSNRKSDCTAMPPLSSNNLLGTVNVYSHHITCEPRDVSITVSPYTQEQLRTAVATETLTLSSKKPEWNSRYKMYELDFGGRICKDSVKNFQVEDKGDIVLQFGRSSFTDFCLDFQEPFSPVAAFGVAISSIHSC